MSCVKANNTYYLTNVKGGTCVDISGGDNYSIIGYPYHGGPNQLWTFESAGNQMWYIKSKSGQYLSMESGDLHDGKKVVAAEPYAWRIEDAQDGIRLSPASNKFFNIDLSDHGNPTPGTPIELWGRWEGLNQVWKLQQV